MRVIKVFSLLLAMLLGGCNGGSDNSASVNSGEVGSVAVLLTDGAIDSFDQFWLTVTEIALLGDDGKVILFSGSERLDLLDLNSHADLFSLADNIPAGYYHKIRMRVSAPLLVRLDADGNVLESIEPEMSGNGKLDLNPRSVLHVLPGETLALQIDLDANKSIHLIQQGNGAYRFRPVVFVDVLTDSISGKLVRVAGFAGAVGDNGFALCRSGLMLVHHHEDENDDDSDSGHDEDDDNHSDSGHDEDEDNHSDSGHDEDEDDHERCIQVLTDADTAFFNEEGIPLQAATVTEGEPVTVLGYYRNLGDHKIGLDAQVVELATAGIYQQTTGVVDALDLDNHAFTLRRSDDTLLTVEFDDISKFFAMSGASLGVDDLKPGDVVKVDGVLTVADDLIKAAAIFIDVAVSSAEQLSGTVSALHDDLLGFDMSDATLGDVCVRVNNSSHYYLLTLVGDSFNSEAVAYSDLQLTQHVEAYGSFNLSGCFVAEDILAEAL